MHSFDRYRSCFHKREAFSLFLPVNSQLVSCNWLEEPGVPGEKRHLNPKSLETFSHALSPNSVSNERQLAVSGNALDHRVIRKEKKEWGFTLLSTA